MRLAVDAACIEYGDHVGDAVRDAVRRDVGRLVTLTEAAQVRRDGAVARVGERLHLVAPQVVRVRPAVHQEHRRAILRPVDEDLYPDATIPLNTHARTILTPPRNLSGR